MYIRVIQNVDVAPSHSIDYKSGLDHAPKVWAHLHANYELRWPFEEHKGIAMGKVNLLYYSS